MQDLLIRFVIFIRSLKEPIPGGLIAFRQERRMSVGVLTISAFQRN